MQLQAWTGLGKFSTRWLGLGLGCMALLWIIGLSVGPAPPPPPPPASRLYPPLGPAATWSIRADEVRQAYLHAYSGYQRIAADHDELLPVSGGKANKYISSLVKPFMN